jgi:hypothetical protein
MSAIVDTIPTPVVEKVKPERKPTLPAKYAKFMQFGFWFAGQIKDKVLDEEAYNKVIDALAVYDELSVQTDLYQSFLDKDNMKENNKTLRKAIAARKKELAKANAPPKKPRASKKKADADAADADDKTEKVKKPRASKKKTADLVDELVTLASGEPTVPPDAPSLIKEDVVLPPTPPLDPKADKKAADKAAKDAKKAADKAAKDAQKAAKDALKKSKTKKEPKPSTTLVAQIPSASLDNDNDEGEECDVRELIYNDVKYWIDDNTGNVFDYNSNDHIGTFNIDAKTMKLF